MTTLAKMTNQGNISLDRKVDLDDNIRIIKRHLIFGGSLETVILLLGLFFVKNRWQCLSDNFAMSGEYVLSFEEKN